MTKKTPGPLAPPVRRSPNLTKEGERVTKRVGCEPEHDRPLVLLDHLDHKEEGEGEGDDDEEDGEDDQELGTDSLAVLTGWAGNG